MTECPAAVFMGISGQASLIRHLILPEISKQQRHSGVKPRFSFWLVSMALLGSAGRCCNYTILGSKSIFSQLTTIKIYSDHLFASNI